MLIRSQNSSRPGHFHSLVCLFPGFGHYVQQCFIVLKKKRKIPLTTFVEIQIFDHISKNLKRQNNLLRAAPRRLNSIRVFSSVSGKKMLQQCTSISIESQVMNTVKSSMMPSVKCSTSKPTEILLKVFLFLFNFSVQFA